MRYNIILVFFLSAIFNNNAKAQALKLKLTEHNANVESAVYSPNGKYLATGGWDGLVHLYTIDSFGNPKFQQSFAGHLGAINSLWFSKNSKIIVSCGKDFSARIWNIDTPELIKTFNNNTESVKNAFLDPSGKYIITCSTDGTIKSTNIYDIKKSKTVTVGKPLNDVLMSSDKKFYYVAKGSNILKINIITGKTEAELIGHKDEVNAIDLSTDGKTLVSGSSDKTIKTWDLATLKEIKQYIGYEWKVTSVEYSVDGKYIVGGCNTGETKLFDTEAGKEIASFKEMGKNVKDVAFSPDAKHLAITTSMDVEKFGALIYSTGVAIAPPSPPIKKATTTPKTTKTVLPKK